MDKMLIQRMDYALKRLYGFMLGFGVILMFLATVGLVDKCMVSYGDITRITEVSYRQCVAHVSYMDYDHKTYQTLVPVECPPNSEYGRVIVLKYSPWNSQRVSVGYPWLTCDDGILLYKFGMFIVFISLPYYVYMCWRDKRTESRSNDVEYV